MKIKSNFFFFYFSSVGSQSKFCLSSWRQPSDLFLDLSLTLSQVQVFLTYTWKKKKKQSKNNNKKKQCPLLTLNHPPTPNRFCWSSWMLQAEWGWAPFLKFSFPAVLHCRLGLGSNIYRCPASSRSP